MRTITVQSELGELSRVRNEVEAYIKDAFDSIETNRIVLSVDEALANIIEHAYGQGSDAPIEVEMDLRADRVVFRLLDRAPLFDPTGLPPPDLDKIARSNHAGGLGVFLYTTLMDASHAPREGGGNALTLEKLRNASR